MTALKKKEKLEIAQAIFFDTSALPQNCLSTTCRLAFDLDLCNDIEEQQEQQGDVSLHTSATDQPLGYFKVGDRTARAVIDGTIQFGGKGLM